jgi:hypothetical protein
MEKGTKELGEMLKFVCALADGIGEAAKDGSVTLGDAAHLIPRLYKLPSAADGIAEIPAEVADLSQDEVAALVAMIKDELDLPQDKLEMAIEDALEIGIKIYALVQKLKA